LFPSSLYLSTTLIRTFSTARCRKCRCKNFRLLYGIFITSFTVSYDLSLVSYFYILGSSVLLSTFFPMAQQPLEGQGLHIIEASRSHSMTHTRYDLSVLGISPRDLYLTIHNTQRERDIHAPVVIRTCNPSKRSAADRRLPYSLVNHFFRSYVYWTVHHCDS